MKPNLLIKSVRRVFVSANLLFWSSLSAAQDQVVYESGHGALQVFDDQGWASAPEWVQVWIGVMAISFIVGIVFVKNNKPARWIIGGLIATILMAQFGFPFLGLKPLSGLIALMHMIFWTPGLYLLVKERAYLSGLNAYSVWAGWITAVIVFSFIFDIRDAAIYVHHMLLG